MRESTIEQYLVDRVKAMGGEVRKVSWIGRRGAPDRLVMLPETIDVLPKIYAGLVQGISEDGEFTRRPRTIWVELKAPGEKPKPHQAREHERMRRMGQRVVVIDSIERVDDILN